MDWDMKKHKYTIRKLGFIVFLAVLVYSPFGVAEYKSRTTTDPFILMAREIERQPIGNIDVLYLQEHPTREGAITLVAFLPDYPDWNDRLERENFKRDVISTVMGYGYNQVGITIGWDYPPPDFQVQGLIACEEPRASLCKYSPIPAQRVDPKYVVWAGIGNP